MHCMCGCLGHVLTCLSVGFIARSVLVLILVRIEYTNLRLTLLQADSLLACRSQWFSSILKLIRYHHYLGANISSLGTCGNTATKRPCSFSNLLLAVTFVRESTVFARVYCSSSQCSLQSSSSKRPIPRKTRKPRRKAGNFMRSVWVQSPMGFFSRNTCRMPVALRNQRSVRPKAQLRDWVYSPPHGNISAATSQRPIAADAEKHTMLYAVVQNACIIPCASGQAQKSSSNGSSSPSMSGSLEDSASGAAASSGASSPLATSTLDCWNSGLSLQFRANGPDFTSSATLASVSLR